MPAAMPTEIPPPADTADFMTVLTALEGRVLAKRISALTPEGIEGYDSATFFDVVGEMPIRNLADYARGLQVLARLPYHAPIRGKLIGTERKTLRRRTTERDGYPATFAAAAHEYIAIDMDGTLYPPNVEPTDLRACGAAARATLPEAFRTALCIVIATSGHCIKPTIRVRLIFWCSRAVSDSDAKRWLAGSPADVSAYNPIQLQYTASPVFLNGCADPLPKRLAYLPGDPVVEVPPLEALAPLPTLPRSTLLRASSPAGDLPAYVKGALINGANRIASTSEGHRHRVLVAESASLGRFVVQGQVSEAYVVRLLTAAAEEAGMDDECEVAGCIAWGIAQAGIGKARP